MGLLSLVWFDSIVQTFHVLSERSLVIRSYPSLWVTHFTYFIHPELQSFANVLWSLIVFCASFSLKFESQDLIRAEFNFRKRFQLLAHIALCLFPLLLLAPVEKRFCKPPLCRFPLPFLKETENKSGSAAAK